MGLSPEAGILGGGSVKKMGQYKLQLHRKKSELKVTQPLSYSYFLYTTYFIFGDDFVVVAKINVLLLSCFRSFYELGDLTKRAPASKFFYGCFEKYFISGDTFN